MEIVVRSQEIEMRLSGCELMADVSIVVCFLASGDAHTAQDCYVSML